MPRSRKAQSPRSSTQKQSQPEPRPDPAVALVNPETCAFRALQTVKAAERAADQAVDLGIQIGRVTPEMIEAVYAAFEARRAAALAERAATDPRYRNQFETARSAYGQALQATHHAELALRRLQDQVSTLIIEAASGAGKEKDQRIIELIGTNPIANRAPTV